MLLSKTNNIIVMKQMIYEWAWLHGTNLWTNTISLLINFCFIQFATLVLCHVWCNATRSQVAISSTRHAASAHCFSALSLVLCQTLQTRTIGTPCFSPSIWHSCKSRTSLGTMESGATELLGLLKRGSPFIWGCYNSTKACGCLHTEQAKDEWAALRLHTCANKSGGSAKGKATHVWSPWANCDEYIHKIAKQSY